MNKTIIRCLGTDDSVNACDCCGRSDLKATVAFEVEGGEVLYFGVVCAARATARNAAEIRRMAKLADDAAAAEAEAKRRAEAEAEMARWVAHLVAKTGGIKDAMGKLDVFRMIRAAGGIAAAREGFAP
ncbi:MAG: hypothetical protein EBR82_68570 [Caulobacteraceae bacterium]|nr:hypothetical protein [Caulobacteraceae bacterium]